MNEHQHQGEVASLLFFLTKVVVGDTFNNGMGVLADMLNEATSDYLPGFAAALIAHGLVV